MILGNDANGVYKTLPDGRVLRVQERIYNSMLTLSSSQSDEGWEEGW
jgi:hypothetical protein